MCMAKDVRLKLEKASGVIGDVRRSGDPALLFIGYKNAEQ